VLYWVAAQSGTLVNAVLHHCSLPAMRVESGSRPRAALFPDDAAAGASAGGEEDEEELEDADGDEEGGEGAQLMLAPSGGAAAVLRPGIVHRLDKGCVLHPCRMACRMRVHALCCMPPAAAPC
jgi:23S rRNA pseudouridine1911/1915/1917 synthase